MNVDKWILPNLCYITIHGSQAYGTNTELSDVDVKGIVLPPKEVRSHLFEKFDQAINNPLVEEQFGNLKNPKNPKFESTVYSLSKFFQLAAQVNPNIIELLYSNKEDVKYCDLVGLKLRENRDMFLSTKAKFTFQGYSYAQFAKIERHRKWLLKGELKKPERADYGLQGEVLKGYGEIQRLVKQDIENWNLSKFGFDDLERNNLKEVLWDAVFRLSTNKVTWDNWPEKYEQAALTKFLEDFDVSEEITDLITRETKYKNDLRDYDNWLNWKEKRNLERKKLEKEFNYDTKHGSHLMRLSRMGVEILEGKGVIVKRPDAEELLAIRRGIWTYEELKEKFEELNKKMDDLYKTTTLPRSVDYEKINNFYHELSST